MDKPLSLIESLMSRKANEFSEIAWLLSLIYEGSDLTMGVMTLSK